MLYFIGLGLGDPEDITVKGLEIVKKAKRVYLESYTSILSVGKEKLEEFYGREVIVADREMVEQDSDSILQNGAEEDVAFLVVGDPFGATTHADMALRAYQKGIPYKVVHNASILNAVGCCGLQLYRFGETISIVFWTENWKPDSFYDKIKINRNNGLHTLCLLDIKVKEQSIENLIKGKKIYEPPRFMTVSCAAQQLLEIIEKKKACGDENLVGLALLLIFSLHIIFNFTCDKVLWQTRTEWDEVESDGFFTTGMTTQQTAPWDNCHLERGFKLLRTFGEVGSWRKQPCRGYRRKAEFCVSGCQIVQELGAA
ncbi:diphthine methyl ester synthase [Trichonephila clavata]|uniref:diphthine methyl ester synthase n=1 Tax=Trichonephila clavata TaxID=2740835 RepID=A0A8X6IVV9_TRICU|nr:diphthine methyl ester synthase [Trichonephila clavata]